MIPYCNTFNCYKYPWLLFDRKRTTHEFTYSLNIRWINTPYNSSIFSAFQLLSTYLSGVFVSLALIYPLTPVLLLYIVIVYPSWLTSRPWYLVFITYLVNELSHPSSPDCTPPLTWGRFGPMVRSHGSEFSTFAGLICLLIFHYIGKKLIGQSSVPLCLGKI